MLYTWMNFHICIHPCNHHIDQNIENFQHSKKKTPQKAKKPYSWFLFTTLIHSHHYPNFYHHKLVLAHFEFYKNRIIQYVLLCIWLWSRNMSVRIIHVVCVNMLFQKLLLQCFTGQLFHYISIFLLTGIWVIE